MSERDDDEAEIEIAEMDLRGVYAPSVPRRVIFSEVLEFRIADLPRREPQIYIDPRHLEDVETDD